MSYLVLAAVFTGIVATLAHAFAFEFPATKSALNATLLDVRLTQRDVLLDEDIVEFESGAVVRDARSTLEHAKVVAGLAGAFAVGAVIAGVLVVGVVAPQQDTPTPTLTTSPPASTTTAKTASATTAAPPPTSSVATSSATTAIP